jgi:hypothetical protein
MITLDEALKELKDAADLIYRLARTNEDYIAAGHYRMCAEDPDRPDTSARFAEFRALMGRLGSLEFENDSDGDKVYDIEQDLNEWGCKAFNTHDWVYDQCGYWQHQYCLHCRCAKYPDLSGKRCGELTEKMGKMTEAQYLETQP